MAYNFKAAEADGLTPQEITNYLASQGRLKEAEEYYKPRKGFLSDVKESFLRRTDEIKKIESGAYNQTLPERFTDSAGQAFGFTGDAIGAGIVHGLKAITPNSLETPISEKLKGLARNVGSSPTLQSAVQGYQNFAQNNPRVSRQINAAFNIGMNLPPAKLTQIGVRGAKELGETALEQGAKVGGEMAVKGGNLARTGLEVAQDAITPIDQGVETILKETTLEKLNRYAKLAEDAVNDPRLPTPLEVAGHEAKKAQTTIQKMMNQAGEAKKLATEAVANKSVGSDVFKSIQGIRQGIKQFGLDVRKGVLQNAKGRVNTIANSEDLKLLQDILNKLDSVQSNPTFRKIDDTIDYIQSSLYSRPLLAGKMDRKLKAFLKDEVGKLNTSLKKIGGQEYAKANADYAKLVKISTALGTRLGEDAAKGGSLMKRFFSPADGGTKKLFRDVKDLTGIDLGQDATLAKFVMETLGDSRQKMLLQQITELPTNAKGFVGKAVDFAADKLQDPIGKARRIIEKNRPKGDAPSSGLSTGKPLTKSGIGGSVKSMKGDEAFGMVAGFEQDENGNIRFNPQKAALGFAGFSVAKKVPGLGKAIAKGADDLVTPNGLRALLRNAGLKQMESSGIGRAGLARSFGDFSVKDEVVTTYSRLGKGYKTKQRSVPTGNFEVFVANDQVAEQVQQLLGKPLSKNGYSLIYSKEQLTKLKK